MSMQSVHGPPEFAKYKLLGEIGHGGMATVYRAIDVRLGREVAVKLIHPHLRENQEVAARFVAEARAVAKLKHPGIVEIFDVSDEEDSERFLVAELVRGPSLRALLKDHTDMPAEIAACFGCLLCDALGHAHDAGIVHRDVKPENVLVDINESRQAAQVKLTDFGIAKVLDAQGVTSTGQVLGSPAHMAPEQIEGASVDVRTDVFSVGVLVYECMVGRLPFEGKNPAQVLRRVLDCCYVPADQARPTVGARWAAVVAKAIQREPEARYASVRDFGEAMRELLQEAGISDPQLEIYRYLSDPKQYAASFVPELVQRLVSRAQQARRQGKVAKAAAELNRAIAYAPDDSHLLKLATDLARGSRRKRLMAQAAAGTVVFLLVGVATYAATRWSRHERLVASSSGIGSLRVTPALIQAPTVVPAPPIVSALSPAAEPQPSATAHHRVPANPMPLPKAKRLVRITADPQSALVSVDGSAPVPVGFGLERLLDVGPHTFDFTVAPGNTCCNRRTITLEVTAGDGTQRVVGKLPLRDATLSLAGGPAEARLSCPGIRVEVAQGASVQVPMDVYGKQVNCIFKGPGLADAPKTLWLTAGKREAVRWPGS